MFDRANPEIGFFISDGNKLAHQINRPTDADGKTPGVLLLHGSSSALGKGRVLFETFQAQLADNGFTSMAYDSRGIGDSEGEYFDSTLDNRLRDAEAAYQRFLAEDLLDMSKISLVGVSMGGHIAARLAGKHPEWFRNIVFANPAAYSPEAEDKRLKPYTEFTDTIRPENSWANSLAFTSLARFPGNSLLIRSELDNVVPAEVIERYILAATGRITKVVIPNMPHIFLSGTDAASEAARQFFYQKTINFLN